MTTLTNSAEGGTSTTTVTTGNSGGASGNAFDVVTIGTGAADTFDNAHAAHGTLAYKVSTAATSTTALNEWSTSIGSSSQMWFRVYLYFTANPAANTPVLAIFSGSTQSGFVQVGTGGKLDFRNSASASVFTTTATIPLNQWFRIEGFLIPSATVGQVELKLFKTADSTTPDETDTSAATQNTGSANPDNARFGIAKNGANLGPYWMDDLGLSNTGYIGPVATGPADQPQVQPGPVWFNLFKPWAQRPVPPLPATPAVSATGSFTLAPLALPGQAGQTSPDQPQAQPGPLWQRIFRPWAQRPVPPAPAAQNVGATGSFALAPLAFTASGGQSSPDVRQSAPGPSWLRLFQPWIPKPVPPPPAFPSVGATGSFALAPLAFTAQGGQSSPDQPAAQPGPTWLDLFRPWAPRPRPVTPVAPPARVTASGSLALAPLAFTAAAGRSSPDLPQVSPGPWWLRLFQPQAARPVPPPPALQAVTSAGSLSLAPLTLAGTAGQTAPDIPQADPGPWWLRLFKPWVRHPAPPPPATGAVSGTGSLILAPLALSGTGIAGQLAQDQPQAQPGPYWLRLFKPWVQRPAPPPPAVQSVSAAGGFTLAPLAFTGQAGQTAPDQPQVSPGPFWLRLFQPQAPRPVPIPSAPPRAVPPGPPPFFRTGLIRFQWAAGITAGTPGGTGGTPSSGPQGLAVPGAAQPGQAAPGGAGASGTAVIATGPPRWQWHTGNPSADT